MFAPQEVTKVSLLYRASEHGWHPADFHKYCDDKGPTLSLVRCKYGYLAAGFTSKSWTTYGKDVEDSSAIVFALTNDLLALKPNNPKMAVYHSSVGGPYF